MSESGLKVTGVRIAFRPDEGKVKAYLDVTFNDIMTVSGFKVIDAGTGSGPFIGNPSKLGKKVNPETGKIPWFDTVRFIDQETAEYMKGEIMEMANRENAQPAEEKPEEPEAPPQQEEPADELPGIGDW